MPASFKPSQGSIYLKHCGSILLRPDDRITGIDYDDDLEVVVVRTERETNYEEKMKKKVRTSGCAQGTVFATCERCRGAMK